MTELKAPVVKERWTAGPTIHPNADEWAKHGYFEIRGDDFSVVGYWDNSMLEEAAPKARARAFLAASAPELYEADEDAANEILRVADYLKTALDNGEPIHESRWLDGLIEAHGKLWAALSKARGEGADNG